jgi:16S rRNA (guanine(966)-N(2))-methyltransferase RsmD
MSRVRITGGAWRSRLVQVVDAQGLRPTPDRVRETLFNWIGQDLSGLACLDLFAGSGILGFEAASRGAAGVVLVERDPRVVATLRRNAETLGGERLEVVRADALEFALGCARQDRKFDLVMLDPPYRQSWLERLWSVLPAIVQQEARLYVEAEAAVAPPTPWRISRQGRAGQVHYHLLERA